MPVPDLRSSRTVVLVDTNVIIESVRIRCWNGLSGRWQIETVEECRDETQRGAPHRPGYVTVTTRDLDRITAHLVTDIERATLGLSYAPAQDMDSGERDLMAHALRRTSSGDSLWVVCSPDKASVRAAVALGLGDHMFSLEDLVEVAGARPAVRMAEHYTKRWLSDFRTAVHLGL